MGDKTAIEWTDATWNPTLGCSLVSPGCTNCYAMKLASRLAAMGDDNYRHLTDPSKAGPVWSGVVRSLTGKTLTLPLHWNRPRRIFVNSMSDLFHETLPDDAIDRVFAVMALARQHTFQVLTKRAQRMKAYLTSPDLESRLDRAIDAIAPAHWHNTEVADAGGLPLPNVWLGVSAEDQTRACERIPPLLESPAAVRFISAEPLLGYLDLQRLRPVGCSGWIDSLGGREHRGPATISGSPRLDWVIAGGESGPAARPMHPFWARSLRNQCAESGVPFFFKQWGEWAPAPDMPSETQESEELAGRYDGTSLRVGKRRAGRLLDGIEYSESPPPAAKTAVPA